MIHKVNLPTTQPGLEWVLDMQSELVRGLCQASLNTASITPQWVAGQLSSLHPAPDPEWIIKVCQPTRGRGANKPTPFLIMLRELADLPLTTRQALSAAFHNNRQFHRDFDLPSHRLQTLSFLNGDKTSVDLITEFFQYFYEPLFGSKGYDLIDATQNNIISFNRQKFRDDYTAHNKNLLVCPMCDGDLRTPEVDHFYPKSEYAFLSCHPYNLVPICHSCNKDGKFAQIPLTLGAQTPPNQDWFHPYLRPLADWTAGQTNFPAPTTFRVEFGKKAGFELISSDLLTSRRLETLDKLVKFKHWWLSTYKENERTMQRMLDKWKQTNRVRTKADLLDKLQDETDKALIEIGRTGFSILMYYYYQAALDVNSKVFAELWDYFTNGSNLAEAC